jgi:hypothetical protein
MKNKAILSFIVMLLFSLAFMSCDDYIELVPLWAQGSWYTGPSSDSIRIKVCEITSSQYISYEASYDCSGSLTLSEALRLDYSGVSGDIVTFDRAWQVKKLDSGEQLSMGTSGIWLITVYK